MPWISPSLQLRWGSYFKPDPTEQQAVVTMVRLALAGEGGAIITKRLAVEHVADIFGIENVEAVLKDIETEAADQQAKALEQTRAEAASFHGMTSGDHGDDGDKSGQAGGAKSQAPAGD
jgi:hypothetical protein